MTVSAFDYDGFEQWRAGSVRTMTYQDFAKEAARKLGLSVYDPVVSSGLALCYHEPALAVVDIGELISGYGQQADGSFKMRVWRGEHGETEALQSRRPSLSFGDKVAAQHYAMHANDDDAVIAPRLICAEVVIKRPVMVDFAEPYIDGSVLVSAIGVEATRDAFMRHEDVLLNQDGFFDVQEEHGMEGKTLSEMLDVLGPALLNELYIDAYPVFDDEQVVEACLAAGFDGLIQGGNGETAMKAEYKVFSSDAVTLLAVHSLKPPVNTPAQPAPSTLDRGCETSPERRLR